MSLYPTDGSSIPSLNPTTGVYTYPTTGSSTYPTTGSSTPSLYPSHTTGQNATLSAMPNADYMRMLTDFQAEGGVVGQNATKKLEEAQAIIAANQLKNQTTFVGGGSHGFYNDQAAKTTQYPSGTGQNPFSFSSGTTTYSNYDPITNTIGRTLGGFAGNINGGRLNVADLINPDNVFQGDGIQNLNNSYYNENFANAFNEYQATRALPMATNTNEGGFSAAGQAITQGPDGQYYTNTSMNNPVGGNGFDTTLPTQNPATSPVFDPALPPASSAPSDGNVGAVTGGSLLGGLLSGNFEDALRAAGNYYLGQQGVEGAYQTGVTGLEMSQKLGQQAAEAAQFRPYTVTSNLAKVGTDASGGFTAQLSPEQQALQNQLMAQAGGLFGQVGADPATAQAQLYEQMRAIQRPEEERQRLELQDRMLSQGRLGLSSAAHGGASPELLAQETARQEAMARANLGARQQALLEQEQAASLGGLLQAAGYEPQQQALSLLEASRIPAGFVDVGRRAGAEFQSQLGGRGIESYMQGADLANRLQLQQQKGLMDSLLGTQATVEQQLINRILNGADASALTGSGGLLSSILDYFNKDQPNYTLSPAQVDALSDAEREQAMMDLFN